MYIFDCNPWETILKFVKRKEGVAYPVRIIILSFQKQKRKEAAHLLWTVLLIRKRDHLLGMNLGSTKAYYM